MGSEDWYRNTTWDAEIEAAFYAKLKRARDKGQYLEGQAHSLLDSHPDIALRLADESLQYAEGMEAMSHCHRGAAYLRMGQLQKAIHAYEDALDAENGRRSGLLTEAALEYGALVATQRIRDKYKRAADELLAREKRLIFPKQLFKKHASFALMHADFGNPKEAKACAKMALEMAERDHSGISRHPGVGLVGGESAELISRLSKIIDL